MPVDGSAYARIAQDYQDSYDPRSEWTEADWDQDLRQMMNVISRRTQDKDPTGALMSPRQEFLFEGTWMNEQEFNDPEWRRNVYDPWAQGIQDEWRNKRESFNRSQRNRGGGLGSLLTRGGPRNRRSGGSMGSYSRGGGGRGAGGMGSSSGRRYDPAMIAQLIGG